MYHYTKLSLLAIAIATTGAVAYAAKGGMCHFQKTTALNIKSWLHYVDEGLLHRAPVRQ